MVKSKFPGKPTKHFQRRKVSPGINIDDFEGHKVAEDIYYRLTLFDYLFHEEEEVSSFHGFSPHEIKTKSLKKSKIIKEKLKGKCNSVGSSNSLKTDSLKQDKTISTSTSGQISETSTNKNSEPHTNDNNDITEKVNKKNITNNNLQQTVTGKFILPTRSAHSSRVIKPNKRFLQNDGINNSVPYKKQRLKTETNIIDEDNVELLEDNNEVPDELDCTTDYDDTSDKYQTDNTIDKSSDNENSSQQSSPAKFVLRKPRLNIKSQSFSSVEGPFSSSSNKNGHDEGSRHSYHSTTKVVCGVCWVVRSYKFLKQARKFGIFACEPCRRFILKILKLERAELLQPMICISGTGNCQIRNSTFVTHQPFATPPKKLQGDGPRRCQGCWLNLCIRSFKMPVELSKRLATYLPNEILQRLSIMVNNSDVPTKRSSQNKSEELSVVKVIKKKKPEESKKSRNRQKLLLAGPRVKHVCRSASLVLGQPTATFIGSSTVLKNDSSSIAADDDLFSMQSSSSNTENNGEIMDIEVSKKPEIQSMDNQIILKDKNTSLDKPVARMLQDIGRANCELLDGIELHETEKKFAKISIDFWEAYDPEEVLQSGFPLLGVNPFNLRALCFLCGSAGFEKLVHCSCCCESYHTFCVSSHLYSSSKDTNWWKLDWLCPKCTSCELCLKTGGAQLTCSKCMKAYHNNCIPPGRAHISDTSWVCPSCLFCKSCNDTQVHVFIGNMPLCRNCFKQRKKGNFCPLCQRCYDENDYTTKMMECSDCKCWIHANCEGLSDEKYQVLSNLPSTIEFICRDCCKDPPALWSVAVNAELKAGYLNVIRALSKNRSICSYLKASPKKRVCVCQDAHSKPIHLKNLIGQGGDISITNINKTSNGSPITITDDKNADLGLLTPKLTKDDEESLQTVKKEFLNLVTDNKDDVLTKSDGVVRTMGNNDNSQLLSIACNKSDSNIGTDIEAIDDSINSDEDNNHELDEKMCTCIAESNSTVQQLSLMLIKNKATCDEYSSVLEFNRDVEKVLNEIERSDISKIYYKSLRQIFPWFDPRDSIKDGNSEDGLDSVSESKIRECRKSLDGSELDSLKKNVVDSVMNGLLHHEQDYYYIGCDIQDTRVCMLCKGIGEGLSTQEGRLLYCGQNEWVHVNCALWSSEVFEEIDGSLQNVHSAISRARLIRCFGCDKKGASVGCCARSCPSAYHFACAIAASCVFLENKEVFCKLHKNLSSAKEVHKEEDFLIARSVYVELDHKKKKDVLRNEVRLYVGALSIISVGEIVPELSDRDDVIVPCEFICSRLYWSCKEPWRLVRYYVKTKLTTTYQEQIIETDTNYTVDHSLEFTPPPSPVENDYNKQHSVDERDVKLLLNQMIDIICNREDDNNLSEHTATDLLPPELKEAIFEDLPHDLLDGISMHDIFTKMNCDDLMVEVKHEIFGETSNFETIPKRTNFNEEKKRKLLKQSPKQKTYVKTHNNFVKNRRNNISNSVKETNWKPCRLLQVDGTIDFSESEQSDDSCDMMPTSSSQDIGEDRPVKCSRCHRTYRTSLGYERHLATCNSHYLSSSEGESSEEEREKCLNNHYNNNVQYNGTICNKSMDIASNVNGNVQNDLGVGVQEQMAPVYCSIEQSTSSMNEIDLQMNQINHSTQMDINYETSLTYSEEHKEHTVATNSLGNFVNSTPEEQQSIVDIDRTVTSQPTIILQQMPTENVLPTFIPTYPQTQQNVQYITSIDNHQDKFLPGTYHIQSTAAQSIHQPIVQNVPTVVGTIIQTNGVEQIVLNGPTPSIDMYTPQQNNLYITNTPMIVGMETVVSNTVMSSSQFISASVPGMLAASSYSATTTQVFQATKPVIDIPQSYVVVNANPPLIENNAPCLQQNIIQNNVVSQATPWNNIINCQEPYKLNKNVSYQTVTRQIIHEQKEIDGVKMINSTQETIVIEPIPTTPASTDIHIEELPTVETKPIINDIQIIKHNGHMKSNQVKIVELPNSSSVCKEKPQQAVAPVVVKNVLLENGLKSLPQNKNIDIIPAEPVPDVQYKQNNNPIPPQVINNIAPTPPPVNSTTQLPPNPPPVQVPTKQSTPTPIIKVDKGVSTNEKTPNTSNITNNQTLPVIKITKGTKDKPVTKVKKETPPINNNNNNNTRKVIQEEPKITYEITSDDGFSYTTSDIKTAWEKVYETVQKARKSKGLPLLTENPFASPSTMLKKMMGLGNNSVKYLLEQLPGASGCSKYKPVYHQRKLTALEREMAKDIKGNQTGCARTDQYKYCHTRYDMFSWLASRHRRPPKLLPPDNDCINGSRRVNMNLPMAMRYRHLKETAKAVGVFRSDIHGRGLFCLRDIDSGEMVIEYAGEVIRSALTDKRERFYTAKGIGCYMFRIDDKFVVDATMKGNAARFINHSCEPNCYSKVVDILGKKHILIFAMRRILQGEELTYDYKFPLEEDKINCHCLSRRCRKYLN